MFLCDTIGECDELSRTLVIILAKAGFTTFTDLTKLSRLDLGTRLSKVTVRHLASLEGALERRGLDFIPDDSIRLNDGIVNQRRLFRLWQKGVRTYAQISSLLYSDLVEAMGGPQSNFVRDKTTTEKWMKKHKITPWKPPGLQNLTDQTMLQLVKGGIKTLKDVAQKTDHELAQILQPSLCSGAQKKPKVSSLTRARIREIKYALRRSGIALSHKPL